MMYDPDRWTLSPNRRPGEIPRPEHKRFPYQGSILYGLRQIGRCCALMHAAQTGDMSRLFSARDRQAFYQWRNASR